MNEKDILIKIITAKLNKKPAKQMQQRETGLNAKKHQSP